MPDPTDNPSLLPEESVGFNPSALIAAICLPGLGHIVRGEKSRGVLAMVGILGMFLSGMLIGGLDAVDRRTEFWWFIPQAGVGPLAFGVDYIKKERFLVHDRSGNTVTYRPANPDEELDPNPSNTSGVKVLPAGAPPAYIRSLGKSYELGIMFCALAGMTNLIVVIDAGFPTRRGAKKPDSQKTGAAA